MERFLAKETLKNFSSNSLKRRLILYFVYGMIVGMFSNQKFAFPISEHFRGKIDTNSLHLVAVSYHQQNNTFHYDILRVCDFFLTDCDTNATTVSLLVKAVQLFPETWFTTSTKTLLVTYDSFVEYNRRQTEKSDDAVTVNQPTSSLPKITNLTIPYAQEKLSILTTETDQLKVEELISDYLIEFYQIVDARHQRNYENFIFFLHGLFETSSHLHINISTVLVGPENILLINLNKIFLRWLKQPTHQLVLYDANRAKPRFSCGTDEQMLRRIVYVSIDVASVIVKLTDVKLCNPEHGFIIPVSASSFETWKPYVSHVEKWMSQKDPVQNRFKHMFTGIVMSQSTIFNNVTPNGLAINCKQSGGENLTYIAKLDVDEYEFFLLVDLEIDEHRRTVKVRGDDTDFVEVTESDEDASIYTSLRLDFELVGNFHENLIKKPREAIEYVREIGENLAASDVRLEFIDIVSLVSGLLIDHCRPYFPSGSDIIVFFNCLSDDKPNLLLIDDELIAKPSDDLLYFLLEGLYQTYKPLQHFNEIKQTLVFGLNLATTSPTVTFMEYLLPDRIDFFIHYNEIKAKFPYNSVQFPSRVPTGNLPVPIKLNQNTIGATVFGVTVNRNHSTSVRAELTETTDDTLRYAFVLVNDKRLFEPTFQNMSYRVPDETELTILLEYHPISTVAMRANYGPLNHDMQFIYATETLRNVEEEVGLVENEHHNDDRINPKVHVDKFILSGPLGELSFGKTIVRRDSMEIFLKQGRFVDHGNETTDSPHDRSFPYSSTLCDFSSRLVCAGSNLNDVFSLVNLVPYGVIMGFRGKNILDLSSFGENVDLNITKTGVASQKIVHYAHNRSVEVTVDHVQRFLGRPDLRENIEVDCYVESVDLQGGAGKDDFDTILVDNMNNESCANDLLPLNIWTRKFTKVINRLEGRKTTYYVLPDFLGHINIDIETLDTLQTIVLGWKARQTRITEGQSEVGKTTQFMLWRIDQPSAVVKITMNRLARNNISVQFSDKFSTVLGDQRFIVRKNVNDATTHYTLQELNATTKSLNAIGIITDTRIPLDMIALSSATKNTPTRTLVVENEPDRAYIINNKEGSTIINLHAILIPWSRRNQYIFFNNVTIYPPGEFGRILINFRNLIHDYQSVSSSVELTCRREGKQNTVVIFVLIFDTSFNNKSIMGKIFLRNWPNDKLNRVYLVTDNKIRALLSLTGDAGGTVLMRPLPIFLDAIDDRRGVIVYADGGEGHEWKIYLKTGGGVSPAYELIVYEDWFIIRVLCEHNGILATKNDFLVAFKGFELRGRALKKIQLNVDDDVITFE